VGHGCDLILDRLSDLESANRVESREHDADLFRHLLDREVVGLLRHGELLISGYFT
ncbi:MAG: hypothetical protein UT62_C0015G0007, partial [Parcubacteria group bacterium GW2011_GWC1_39_8]